MRFEETESELLQFIIPEIPHRGMHANMGREQEEGKEKAGQPHYMMNFVRRG